MKKLFYAVLVTLCTFSTAHPAVLSIDDFLNNQGPISDLILDGIAVTDILGTPPLTQPAVTDRTLSSNLLSTNAPIQNDVQVTNGILDVTNGTGEDSQINVIWTLKPNLLGAVNSAGIFFTLVESDANQTSATLAIGATPLGSFVIPGNTVNKVLTFDLPLAVVPQINAGGQLTLSLDGDPGWDLSLNRFGLTSNGDVPTVPEPGTVLLLGTGILGLGWWRWRGTRSVN